MFHGTAQFELFITLSMIHRSEYLVSTAAATVVSSFVFGVVKVVLLGGYRGGATGGEGACSLTQSGCGYNQTKK